MQTYLQILLLGDAVGFKNDLQGAYDCFFRLM